MPDKNYSHIFNYISGTPWAIIPESFDQIHQIVSDRSRGIELDRAAIEARGVKLGSTKAPRQIVKQGRTALIPIDGTIAKKMNMFMEISGGTSTEMLQKDIQSALDNRDIDSILLDVYSPGGSIEGVFELSDFVYQSRGKKPIVAYANSVMASAAYLIGSAADEIIAYDSSLVGSIGVISIYYEISKAAEENGTKYTVIKAGKYKGAGNNVEPMTTEAKEYLQSLTDYYYTLFIDAVARNRNISAKKVLEMAEGKVFIGQQALDVGLVDKLGNFDFALQRAEKRRKRMDLATLKAENPEIVTALREEGHKTGLEEGKQAGIKMERERISQIREVTPEGQQDLAEQYIKDGTSVENAMRGFLTAAKAMKTAEVKAENTLRQTKLEDLKLNAPVPVAPQKTEEPKKDLSSLPIEERAKIMWDNSPADRAEFEGLGGYPAFLAYVKNYEKGLIKGKGTGLN